MTLNGVDVLSLGLALVGTVVAVVAICLTLKFRSELALPEQIANIPDFLSKEYLERRFPTRVTQEFEWLHTLKDARFATEKKYELLQQEENYKDAISRFQAVTLNLNADFWERDFAYELSLALEQVGVMVLAGAIPLNIVLAMIAPQIIEDWGYCSKFVEKIRAKRPLKPKESDDKTQIRFHRWHGEWLVYAAAIYMDRYWTGRLLDDLISVVCDGDMQTIRKREEELWEELWEELTKPEYSIVPKNTKKEIEKLLGTDC
ncbi:MAG: hypothetical protein JW878_10595 [Methanomicrobia archaeon]|nr:hypothetical protein [Methanomicrobia archaeon]